MKLTFVAFSLLLATNALAHCPNPVACEMRGVDSSISSVSEKVDADTLNKVKAMRAQAQQLFDEGRDQEALKMLKEARKILRESSGS